MTDARARKPRCGAGAPHVAAIVFCLLAGCVAGNPLATRSAQSPASDVPVLDGKGAVKSLLVTDLTQRSSVLPEGSAFAAIAQSVLQAESGAARAELRVSRLTARAKSKNWLPSIGPDVRLSSLGSLAAGLVLDQAVFDNGRKKAERDFAAADVEVAAVDLATDLNQRVYEGLKLYVEAQRAKELAALTETSLVRMRDFLRIVSIRVEGGLSDRSELRIIEQKLTEMEATLSQEREAETTAWAELEAMSEGDLRGRSGLSGVLPDPSHLAPLGVLKARGEAARTSAEVRMARAGLMPGFGASATLDKGGSIDAGLSLDGEGLGFGRKDSLKALEESEEVSRRRIAEAQETADRRIVALEREIAALTTQETQEAASINQMSANLDLFTEQYRAGRRSLMELVGQFESLVAARRNHASLKYAIAVAQLEIARERGVLVDGAEM